MRLRFAPLLENPGLLLCDPAWAAAQRPTFWRSARARRRIAREATRSFQAVAVELPSAGQHPIDVLIDEPLPKHIAERSWFRADDLGLNLPDGRLAVIPRSMLGRPAATVGARAVPPGLYNAAVLALDWAIDETIAAAPETPRVGERIRLTNALIAIAGLTAMVILALGIRDASRNSLVWAAVPLLLTWLLSTWLTRSRQGEQARIRRAALEASYPTLVVRLRRVGDPRAKAELGPGLVDLNAPIETPLPLPIDAT